MAPSAKDIYVRPSSSSSSPFSTTTPADQENLPVPTRPSACIILLSPTNEVLLLHRTQTSTSFPSAHVFPGGNLSAFHEPALPPQADPERHHADSPAYRLAALRETFEESGILLATTTDAAAAPAAGGGGGGGAPLIRPDAAVAAAARKAIHANKLHFRTWVEDELHARLCADELVPFTRWITPTSGGKGMKRFSTQMYLFAMPLSSSSLSSSQQLPHGEVSTTALPTSDGGIEHTAATFAPAGEWLARQARGEIMLFPPQCFLLTLVAEVFAGVRMAGERGNAYYAAQREALMRFVRAGTATAGQAGTGRAAVTARIPWTEKVMSPEVLFRRESDGRFVLGVDKPGFELKGSGRGGDCERVVLVGFEKGGPRNVEVRNREEVLREHKMEIKDKISKL